MSTELPSFLKRLADDHYELTYSASGGNTMQLCGAKFSWAYLTCIEAVAPRAGANYGDCFHQLLAPLYKGEPFDPQEIVSAHFAENPQPSEMRGGKPEWRTAARALQAFAAYREKYPAEDWEVVAVEEKFEVPLGTFRTPVEIFEPGAEGASRRDFVKVDVKVRGIFDLVVRWHGSLWVVDHKTSTEWSDLKVEEGKCSFQFMLYVWALREMQRRRIAEISKGHGGFCRGCGNAIDPEVCHCGAYIKDHGVYCGHNPVPMGCTCGYADQTQFPKPDPKLVSPIGGAVGNYIIARAPFAEGRKPKANDLPRDQFERHHYPYSDAQLAEWHGRAMRLAQRIWTSWRTEEWDQNDTACAHWGRCEYYQLCWETDPAYRMAAAMGADYRPRTPSPFEESSND